MTHLCRDTCHYCTFVTVPGKLRAEGRDALLIEEIRMRKAADLVVDSAEPTVMDSTEAREKLWTPGAERRGSAAELWTPGAD